MVHQQKDESTQLNTTLSKTQETKADKNNLKDMFIFLAVPCVIPVFLLVVGIFVDNYKGHRIESLGPVCWGIVLGSVLVFVKEFILKLAIDHTKDINKKRSFIITAVFAIFCGCIFYFTVDTSQKYVNALALVTTIFIQNEITAKLWWA